MVLYEHENNFCDLDNKWLHFLFDFSSSKKTTLAHRLKFVFRWSSLWYYRNCILEFEVSPYVCSNVKAPIILGRPFVHLCKQPTWVWKRKIVCSKTSGGQLVLFSAKLNLLCKWAQYLLYYKFLQAEFKGIMEMFLFCASYDEILNTDWSSRACDQ